MISGTVLNISRYAIHDGPGIRTTVFLKGCPLSCWWCHNPESMSPDPRIAIRLSRCIRCAACQAKCPNHAISLSDDEGMITDEESCRHCFACTDVCPADAREIIGRRMTVGEVMAEVKKDVPFYDESGGGVTFSGGEPLAQPEFLLELLDACGRIDLHGTVDTSGYAKKEILLQVADKTDLFLYDLKHMDPDLHLQYTGVGNEVILDNLKALSCRDVAFRVRFPLIPGINDDPKNVESMAAFLQKLHRVCSIDILPYHDVATSKYQRFGYTYRLAGVRAPDAARLQEVAATLSSHGLCVTIGGTDHEPANSQSQKSEPRSQAVHIP